MAVEKSSDSLCFFVNGRKVTEENADPETMLVSFLREKLRLTGTKVSCGGGGCGACTVMVSRYDPLSRTVQHFSANACLLPVCQLAGAAVTTVEGVGSTKTRLHPVQERLAKAHGSQCGFCSPGMVMSMYTLLRNQAAPSMERIREALGGNLCRCTGYRPIIDSCRTFTQESQCCQGNGGVGCCMNAEETPGGEPSTPRLFPTEDLLPLDPTQDLIFPPELMRVALTEPQQTRWFRGERVAWVSPVSLEELVLLKSTHPQAPLVLGNTTLGPEMKFRGVVHPLVISPSRVAPLFEITHTPQGVWVGAGLSLTQVQMVLGARVEALPQEKTELYRSLLHQLRALAGQQIRNVASLGGNIVSALPNSDLNPVLAAGGCRLRVASDAGGSREVPLDQDFFRGFRTTLLGAADVLVAVFVPETRPGEFVRAFRQAPRKENALATVTTGMRVVLGPGAVVRDVQLYYGGVGPCTLRAARTGQALLGRPWGEAMLQEAYSVLLEEVVLPPGAVGGKVGFRRSLTLSLLFKFYLEVQQALALMSTTPEGVQSTTQQGVQSTTQQGVQSTTPEGVPERELSAIRPLPCCIQPGQQGFQEVSGSQSEQDAVGRPVMHRSAPAQATGEAVYVDDTPPPQGELFLALVTSTRPHASILGVDVSAALRLPGVLDMVTHADIPGRKARSFMGYEEELLADKEVSCVGQLVCGVLADSRDRARRGAAAVRVRYQDLPDPVFTVEDAVQRESFFLPRRRIERGDVCKGLETADHVHSGELRLGGQEHFYMEPQSVLVVPVGEETEFHVYVSSQAPTITQEAVAETLGVPSNRVTCHVKRLGGAFGGKVTKTSILAAITAVAAWKTGRAVRCILERGEDMLITGARHPVLGRYQVGFMEDGRITAADLQYYANAGNTVDESTLVVEKMVLHMDNAYNIPNLRGRAVACRTNLPSNTAFRGFGVPQAAAVVESMITDVALCLGRPAHQIREVNMYRGPSVTHYGMRFDPENLWRCWEEVKGRVGLGPRLEALRSFNQDHRWRKRGAALIPIKYGVAFSEAFLNQAAALVHVYKDGSVLVSHGGAEMGQGIHTKMQQVVSRELGVPSSKVYVSETSTASVPNSCPSAASFGTDANGMAVRDACQKLYKRLEPIRTKNPKGSWDSWTRAAFLEKISLSATGFFRGPDCYMDWEKMEGQPYSYFTYGACYSEVELDCLTGDYRTLRTDIVVDVGQSINPSIDIGQVEGAFLQGLGLYTLEQLSFSPGGLLYSRGPSQYKIPAVCDVPLSFNVHLLPDSHNPHAIYSSKGIGEPVLFLGSSVFYAIKDAVSAARAESGLGGAFPLDSPATPERACLACATPFSQRVPVSEPGSFTPWALNI
ncbi:aldehyde oxidase 6 isoform X1 [Gadus chalcogrammus]|uniref:aldehyde oxidase 6 isoform X1 n=2 Tax=Gadus chalcogrammus TaxID=1042646 RepID=UPI0024C25297|nr:aldehyde oxidase 6 isoform X1 [Gadus chalcogrammus]